jgi:hypothetical protein
MTTPAPPDPIPVDLMVDGTAWVEWPHLTGRKRYERFAAVTAAGDVLLPPLGFNLSETAVGEDLAADQRIVFRRREARLYVDTGYLAKLFPEDEARIEYVADAVRRAVSTTRKSE